MGLRIPLEPTGYGYPVSNENFRPLLHDEHNEAVPEEVLELIHCCRSQWPAI